MSGSASEGPLQGAVDGQRKEDEKDVTSLQIAADVSAHRFAHRSATGLRQLSPGCNRGTPDGASRSDALFVKNQKPKSVADSPHPQTLLFGRDTGYICDACHAVMWEPMLREHLPLWKFCPCCGSDLMEPGAQTSYSCAAQEQDVTLTEKIDALGRARRDAINTLSGPTAREPRERSKRANIAVAVRPGPPFKERQPIQPERTHNFARGSAAMQSAALLGSKLLRTKPSIERRRTNRVRRKKASAHDLLSRLKQGKLIGHSRFCDVCGHRGTEVRCSTCPSSFHKVCLGMHDLPSVPEDYQCHTCKRQEIEQSNPTNAATAVEIAETARASWKPPDSPMQCSSCGYHETEAMNCDGCKRWFCFACMSLSAVTLPEKTWSCPECIGQDLYDEGRRRLIAASCQRVQEDKATAREQDRFSQLVFDLSCTCNWEEWERNIATLIEHTRKQLKRGEISSVMPFHSLHYARTGKGKPGMDKMMMRQISEAYAKHAKEEAYRAARVKSRDDSHACEEYRAWKFERLKFAPNDTVCRLRIGYLSSDFVDHPTADLIQSALLKHDRSRFEVFCYSISREDDSDYRKRLQGEMEHFQHFPKSTSDKKCAEMIAADGIHILVNLNGHTAGDRNGISALRPAPLQLVYLAYPGTMGADYIDYNVTDETVCPSKHREFYTERLLYMPHCYQTNSFRELYADVLDPSKLPSRRDHHLPEEPTFVFCNFCRLGRITPELFAVWMKILKRVPNSVIWLYKHPKAAVSRLQMQATRANISSERLIFGSPCSPKLEHLKRVTLADLALDTLVYNGHTTASDMLWAGVPLITKAGDNWPSLVATCILKAAEMPEMVVTSLKDYEDKAVELAFAPEKLQKLKTKLAKRRMTAPLFDSGLWIHDFEKGLDEVWRRANSDNDQNSGDLFVKTLKPDLARVRPVEEKLLSSVSMTAVKSARAGASECTANRILQGVETQKEAACHGSSMSAVDVSPKNRKRKKQNLVEADCTSAGQGASARTPMTAAPNKSEKVTRLLQMAAERMKKNVPLEMMRAPVPGQLEGRKGQSSRALGAAVASRAQKPNLTSDRHNASSLTATHPCDWKTGLHTAPEGNMPAGINSGGCQKIRASEVTVSRRLSTCQAISDRQQHGPQLLPSSNPSSGLSAQPVVEHSVVRQQEVAEGDQREIDVGVHSTANGTKQTEPEPAAPGRSGHLSYPLSSIPKIPKKRKVATDSDEVQIVYPSAEDDMKAHANPSTRINDLISGNQTHHLHTQDTKSMECHQHNHGYASSLSRTANLACNRSEQRVMQNGVLHACDESSTELMLGGSLPGLSAPLQRSNQDDGGDAGLLMLADIANVDMALASQPEAAHGFHRHMPMQVADGSDVANGRNIEFSLREMHRLSRTGIGASLHQFVASNSQHIRQPSGDNAREYPLHRHSQDHQARYHCNQSCPRPASTGQGHANIRAKWAGGLADVMTSQRASSGHPTHAVMMPQAPCLVSSHCVGAGSGSLKDEKDASTVHQAAGAAALRPADCLVADGTTPDGKAELIERIKQEIKLKVRACCNDEYRQHYRKQSATDAVKAHLKLVAAKAQNTLMGIVARVQPGQSMQHATVENMQAGLRDLTDELTFKCVVNASNILVPQFHWLSDPCCRAASGHALRIS